MSEIYSIVSILIFSSPIIVAAVAYFGIWFRDNFWAEQLYEYED